MDFRNSDGGKQRWRDGRGTDLYVIQMAVTGDVKVGRSKHPEKRLRELQTGSPHRLRMILHVRGEGHREREVHRRMEGRGTRGEWFEVGALADLPDELYEQLDLESQDWWRIPVQGG